MKLKIIVSVLFLFLTTFISSAEEAETLAMPAGDVPEVYIVKEGDTLWDIAEKFFGDPFTWPDIWKKNLFIDDPHWIYPGQEITLKLLLEKIAEPELPPEKPLKQPEPLFIETAPRTVVSETVVERDVSIPVSEEDRDVISILRNPQPTYRKESFMRTGFISKRSEIPGEKIVKIDGDINIATRNDFVYVDIGRNEGVSEGDMLAVLAVGDRVKHPDTGKDLGFVVRIKGILEVLSSGDDQMRCMVTESFDPIAEDDIVMPIRLTSAPEFDAWVRPKEIIKGTILAINESLISIHINDTLYIDKGSNDGVRPGDRFMVYSRDDDLDDTGHRDPLGEIQAVNVMPGETAVIVVSLKGEKINIGDRTELSARCRLIY